MYQMFTHSSEEGTKWYTWKGRNSLLNQILASVYLRFAFKMTVWEHFSCSLKIFSIWS